MTCRGIETSLGISMASINKILQDQWAVCSRWISLTQGHQRPCITFTQVSYNGSKEMTPKVKLIDFVGLPKGFIYKQKLFAEEAYGSKWLPISSALT